MMMSCLISTEDSRRSNHGQFDHISSPLKNAVEGSRRPQPYRDQAMDEDEDFRGNDRRQRPQPPQQQSRDYYYDVGNRNAHYDNYGNGYPDAPHASTNDSLSYSNTYVNYPPKPNYHPNHASAPYHDRQNNHGYNHGSQNNDPRYDPSAGGYPSYQNRSRPNNHMYPVQDNSGYSDFDTSQISDRSVNNYLPSNYHNGNPQSGQHYVQQRPRNYQQQPPAHHHRPGQGYAPAEYADADDKDLSFVSESRLLPANPWSSSDMLSNLIPLGSKFESQRATNKNRSELEQSLTSNSLLLYLGNRTPLVEPTRDNTISAGNNRARSASTTPQRNVSAAKPTTATPKGDHGSDERLKRLIEDTNMVIDRELNATSAAAGLQRQPKDSMKNLIGYQQEVVDRPRGNATPGTYLDII